MTSATFPNIAATGSVDRLLVEMNGDGIYTVIPMHFGDDFGPDTRGVKEGIHIALGFVAGCSGPVPPHRGLEVRLVLRQIAALRPEEVVNLRRAMDLLLSQPKVDPQRFAYVGHDFGGMYGVLAGSLDGRPTHYVLMASTPRFPDWYLYLPRLEGDARAAFIEQMAEIDPITHIPNLAPASLLFQFATDDFHVPKERAEEFFAAAKDPRELKWYEAGHGLNEAATIDRKAWLKHALGLG